MGYSKIYHLGHRAIYDLFGGEVSVSEKLDGSFGCMYVENGQLHCRSRNKELELEAPEKLFSKVVQTAKDLAPLMQDGWRYYGECIQTPCHNTLEYERVPVKYFILFDVDKGGQNYLNDIDRKIEADRLGLEMAPILFKGVVEDIDHLKSFLEKTSILGKAKIEGFVVKNYDRFCVDGKTMMGKYVSEEFKETHQKRWKANNQNSADMITQLIQTYKSEARWQKAVQHLDEDGRLDGSPKDIGPLIKEVQNDIMAECQEEIKEKLFAWAWKQISGRLTNGLPSWFKQKLLEKAFDKEDKD